MTRLQQAQQRFNDAQRGAPAPVPGWRARLSTAAGSVGAVLGLLLVMRPYFTASDAALPAGPMAPYRVLASAAPAEPEDCPLSACGVALAAAPVTSMAGLAIPDSAVTRRGTGSVAWVVVAGRAVPLQLQVASRAGTTAIVTEENTGGARGLAIAPDDWRALPPGVRQELYQAARAGALLTPASRLIDLPGAGLAAGAKVRVRIHAGVPHG